MDSSLDSMVFKRTGNWLSTEIKTTAPLRLKRMPMLRCGIDMIEHQRVEEGIQRLGERFLNRFFTAGEREDCNDKPG